ncbi:MAG: LytTR family transcriptional regulator [Bacteroidota bacterium]
MKEILQLKEHIKLDVTDSLTTFKAIAELYSKINVEDSAYHYYLKTYDIIEARDEFQKYPDLILDIHKTVASRKNYTRDGRLFLEKYGELIHTDTTERIKAHYFMQRAIDYMEESKDSLKLINIANATLFLNKASQTKFFKNNKPFRTNVLFKFGHMANHLEEDYEKADSLFQKTLVRFKEEKNNQYIFYNLINIGNNYLEWGKYEKAIAVLKEADIVNFQDFKIKSLSYLYYNYERAYDSIGDFEKALAYRKSGKKIDSLIEKVKKDASFYEVEVKHSANSLRKEVKSQNKILSKLKKNKWYFIIGLVVTFLLSLYSYIRWKKLDRRKRIIEKEKKVLEDKKQELEEENKSIQEEVEKIKQLVVDNYILLKNKRRIKLNLLIYIRSDDAFLRLYTTEKEEFVRGKISDIEKQLPPNFIRIHRSHIINLNFLQSNSSTVAFLTDGTELTISRKYKHNIPKK